jgi:mono/diheme cytochrome c family protein
LALTLAIVALGVATAPLAAAEITYTRDVAPIFVDSCGACHRPAGIAPMSRLSFESARPWARAIQRKVISRRMPPFHARGSDFAMKHDTSLDQRQIETIGAWVRGGAKQGDPDAMPQIPDYDAEARRGPQPDLLLEFGEAFPVPPHADMQRAFTIKNDLGRDVRIRGVDYEPDLNPVVHHMFVFTDPSGLGREFQEADPGIGFLASVDADGREGKLKSGDVVLLRAGVPVRWRTDERFRKLYVSFDPASQAGNTPR